jgi:glutathione-regulated potassium-efflux system ancillary protein KefC
VFESSLRSGRCVLELLGHSETSAQEITAQFREHNLSLIEQMYPHHQDRAKLIAVAKQGRQTLEAQMAQERALRTGNVKPKQDH